MKVRVAGEEMVDIILPMEDAVLNDHMKKIGVNECVPFCYLDQVMDDESPLQAMVGKTVNMDEVNYLAKRWDSLTDYERKVIVSYVRLNETSDLKDLINLTFCPEGLSLLTDFSDMEQVGKQLYMDESKGIPEDRINEIDFRLFAHEVWEDNVLELTPDGVYIEHGFCLENIYNGRTFPVYVHHPDQTVAILEIGNQNGDKDYLYLPTDICSFQKMKARLQVESFSECEIQEIHVLQMPDWIIPEPDDIKTVEDLSYFNEMCHAIVDFDDLKMKQLSMAAEFAGTKRFTDITCIAKHLDEFEINPYVHNDEEYGRFIVTESGLYREDERLLPHIDDKGFAESRKSITLAASGYVMEGFVGATRELNEYLNYRGEYCEPLEISRKLAAFCFYSPLEATLIMEKGRTERLDNLLPCQEIIGKELEKYASPKEEARGIMHYFEGTPSIAAKVITARPAVREFEGELYGALECRIKEPLTEAETEELREYWCQQMTDDWGHGFENVLIPIHKGKIIVSFWNCSDDWEVMTEEEMCSRQLQEVRITL